MRTRLPLALALAAPSLWACTAEFTSPPPPTRGGAVRPECVEIAQRLAIGHGDAEDPPSRRGCDGADYCVAEEQLLVLTASGGTGVYRWRMGGAAPAR